MVDGVMSLPLNFGLGCVTCSGPVGGWWARRKQRVARSCADGLVLVFLCHLHEKENSWVVAASSAGNRASPTPMLEGKLNTHCRMALLCAVIVVVNDQHSHRAGSRPAPGPLGAGFLGFLGWSRSVLRHYMMPSGSAHLSFTHWLPHPSVLLCSTL